MQLFTRVTAPSWLALAPIVSVLRYCASTAPHPHPKCRKTDLYTEPCCAFSFCQAEIQGDNSLLGVSATYRGYADGIRTRRSGVHAVVRRDAIHGDLALDGAVRITDDRFLIQDHEGSGNGNGDVGYGA
ncbi:hypothetical protein FIBSPDRAFT_867899 [Athelia psychrophila]|uniref:Uncharacterized protein n=1 Tax=Athelia psychrophila TaxID=1759441 RepID=A0A166DJ58_9AGAM|nr:hypothetical protein FIBSPDRAFT_867899 [Fibularhizoctonia sp. CBS 109695]